MAAPINGVATIEIDELVPVMVNGAVLYRRAISVGAIELAIEPEWEIELA